MEGYSPPPPGSGSKPNETTKFDGQYYIINCGLRWKTG